MVFKSTSQSMLLLKILRSKGYDVKVISAPCSISSGCARAIKFKESDLESIKKEILDNNVSIYGMYKKTFSGYRVVYTKLL
ncbi:DUF3343 domain-containing protein [Clostridium sp. ZS2-4]|uniref:DUF3343 domain-containing protein n=1 Tax=Clostridium sp. ZS2-4 TaxID=2987703 RepID=UPI00227B142E|nr:DUF3343 domain-containing protein [Clostridium sp. ZS2-4]MCY6356389.1 DUF3343 domain-containing protein [Clostridium sp. ZS2-4]